MKLPLNTDLTGKTVVITGAGGVLGGMFAKALAQAGGKVALLDPVSYTHLTLPTTSRV